VKAPVVRCPHCHGVLRPKCRACDERLGERNRTGLCRRCFCVAQNSDPEMIAKMAKAKKEHWEKEHWLAWYGHTVPE